MDAFDLLADDIAAVGSTREPWAVGTVTAVDPGGGTDGHALVTVDYQGTAVKAAHAASYTPVADDVVLLARVGYRFVAVCSVVGTPPTS